MKESHTLVAFLATLCAIIVLVIAGAIIALNGHSSEALGIGGAVTGLIGVIGTFKPRTVTPDTPQDVKVINESKDAVPVAEENTDVRNSK